MFNELFLNVKPCSANLHLLNPNKTSSMKIKIALFSVLVSTLFLSSCIFSPGIKGNGNVEEEERKIDQFDEVKASRGVNVYLTQGEEFKVVVRADENLIDIIETEVLGDELIVRSTKNVRNAKEYKVFVSAPDYESVISSSGSNVYSETEINTDDLEVSASAGANITLEINVDELEASASAGANIYLDGLAEECEARASAGSNIKAEDLRTNNADLKVSSGANIWIEIDNNLKAGASSGGNVFYNGEPKQTDISKSSGGNVIKN